jgi:hypothetical protein
LQSIICGRDFLEIVGVKTLENVESVVAWKCKAMQAHSILP